MATTARELLALLREEAARIERPSADDAEIAITALGYAAHRLDQLTRNAPTVSAARRTSIGQLITACRAAHAAWPGRPGRLADLLGAACDASASHHTNLGEEARWAFALELSRAVQHCVQVALRHAPHARVPALHWVRAATVEIERHAARRPPAPRSSVVLDLPIPAPHPNETTHAAEVVNATARLARALRRECATGPLPISAALATSAIAEDAARRACPLASTGSRLNAGPWRAAPAGWQVVYAALIRFHDGNRRDRAEPSATVHAARALQLALTRFGGVVQPDAAAASALRAVASQLPLLARDLETAARVWGQSRALCARARDLLRTDDLASAILNDATVPVDAYHLVPVVAAIRVSERLSAALSAELDRAAGHLGRQPQPHLVPARGARATDRRLGTDAEWATRLSARAGHCSHLPL